MFKYQIYSVSSFSHLNIFWFSSFMTLKTEFLWIVELLEEQNSLLKTGLTGLIDVLLSGNLFNFIRFTDALQTAACIFD